MAVTGEHSLKELKEEVEKCELICQNCHREKHADNKMGEDIEDHTINWDEYTETDMTLDGYSVFRNEASKKCILRECEYCDQMFMARVDSYENGRGRFHSLSCAGKSSKRNDKNTKRGLVKVLKREGECSTKDCDESRPHCLDFHHIDKENKDEHIRQIVENGDIEKLRSELEKCEFLCANCHQVNHSTNS